MPFLSRLGEKATRMPLHLAAKQVEVNPGESKRDGVQFERFIFDILPEAGDRYLVVETTHEDEFAPLKNETGADSPPEVRRALSAQAARWLGRTGVTVPNGLPIELSPLAALEPDDLNRGGKFGIRVELPA